MPDEFLTAEEIAAANRQWAERNPQLVAPVTDWNTQAAPLETQIYQLAAAYKAEMERRGFTVSMVDTSADSLLYNNLPVYEVTLTKNGVRTGAIVGANLLNAELSSRADMDVTYWGAEAARQGVANSVGVEAFWNSLPVTRAPEWQPMTPPITPGPTPTAPISAPSTQTTQAPNTNSGGTVVTPPAASADLHNFDEWNWIYQHETGRGGPAPEEVGVTNRLAPITRAAWWAIAGQWYSATGNLGAASGGGDTSGAGGGGASGDTSAGSSGGASGASGGAPATDGLSTGAKLAIGGAALVLAILASK